MLQSEKCIAKRELSNLPHSKNSIFQMTSVSLHKQENMHKILLKENLVANKECCSQAWMHTASDDFSSVGVPIDLDLILLRQHGAFHFPPIKEFIQRWQGKIKEWCFCFKLHPWLKPKLGSSKICLSLAQSVPFSLSDVKIPINVKCEYCSTQENKFLASLSLLRYW
ncbi:hypothetical protein EK904_007936 [Melospiza melodia maxima]|nr:hypothetical protein EK904_007936 [Melospiza melodia maxima]